MAALSVGFKPFVFDTLSREWVQLDRVVVGSFDPMTREFAVEASSFGPDFHFGPHLRMDEDLTFVHVRNLRSPEDGELLASEYRQVGGRFKLTVFND